MTSHERKLLHDMLGACEKIVKRTAGKTSESYQDDEDLRLAVERLFTILGEASVRLRRHFPDSAARLPNIDGPIGFRNFLIHVYDQINPAKSWKIIVHDVPPLIRALQEALAEEPQSD